MDDLRRELAALHQELPRNGLVAWTSGNVSARIPGEELMAIKASGVSYDELSSESIVVCDLDGDLVEGAFTPSSDAATHGFVYRAMPDVHGIAHTHSPYATAWAIHGKPVPCVMTAMADEFGGEIPLGPFALIGDEAIGRGIVETLAVPSGNPTGTGRARSRHPSPAVLMRAHGVFTIGPTARAAVKAAVMCEDVARTVHLARALGAVAPLDPESIEALHDRYQNVYGQR